MFPSCLTEQKQGVLCLYVSLVGVALDEKPCVYTALQNDVCGKAALIRQLRALVRGCFALDAERDP